MENESSKIAEVVMITLHLYVWFILFIGMYKIS